MTMCAVLFAATGCSAIEHFLSVDAQQIIPINIKLTRAITRRQAEKSLTQIRYFYFITSRYIYL